MPRQQFSRFSSETMFDQNLIVGLIVLAVAVMAVYAYAPRFRSMLSGIGVEMFADAATSKKVGGANGMKLKATNGAIPSKDKEQAAVAPAAHAALKVPAPATAAKEGFADYDSMGAVPMAGAKKPQGCYPREQLNPMELLPNDPNSQWAQVNPAGAGDIQGKNFLSAGALVGVNTIGQSLRNSNLQLRAEPPNPQSQVSPWLNSTIEPDLQRRPLE
jgi:hypothetical protein